MDTDSETRRNRERRERSPLPAVLYAGPAVGYLPHGFSTPEFRRMLDGWIDRCHTSGQTYTCGDGSMTKYQLAKLILMAEGLRSRKRVQKTVHLLQAAGCPLDAEFRLHYYGPYSAGLAELLDRMVSGGILGETTSETPVGMQYNYQFNEEVRESLEEYEQTPHGQSARAEMERYEHLLGQLCETAPRVLELASTIVAFRQAGSGWEKAAEETAQYKEESVGSPIITEALHLAQTVAGFDDGEDGQDHP